MIEAFFLKLWLITFVLSILWSITLSSERGKQSVLVMWVFNDVVLAVYLAAWWQGV